MSVRGVRGFTLVELLVVFAILALLIGVVPVAFDRLRESAQYRDTLRAMLSEMRAARQRSTNEGAEVRFQIDLSRREFGLEGRSFRPIPTVLQVRVTVAGSEFLPGEVAAIRFLPEGGATGGSIDLVRASGAGARLKVDWLSGRVTQEPLVP